MPGVRLDRFIASTAVIVLLSAAGGALAEPKFGTDIDATPGASVSQLPASDSSQPSVKPTASPQTPATPAAMTKPETSADAPAAATAKPDGSSDQVAPAAADSKPSEPGDQPAAAASKSSEPGEQPAAAAAKPNEPSDQPNAASAKTDDTSGQATAGASAVTEQPNQSTDQPVLTLAPAILAPVTAPSSKQPAAKAVTRTPAAPAPAAAVGGDEVPVVAAGTPPATTQSPVVEADAAISDQLRELANGKFDRTIGGKKERTAIDAFYSARNYAPIWITDGKANARAKAAIAYLAQVDTDGLDPADYPAPDFAALTDPAALAEAELRLTASVVTYAHHAEVGRVHWSRVSGDIYYDQKAPNPTDVLAKMAEATDAAEALDSYEPHHPAYVALKAKLAELRAGKEGVQPPIANGPVLKIGMQDDRVPQVRARLGLHAGSGTTFDKDLADSVKRFQQEHELKVTGTLTAATVEALNGREPDRPIDTIIANLERWRWMPHDLGKTYVMVNLPDFTLRVVRDGRQIWATRIVDGKPAMPTPIMTAEMKYITVNPTWNVPPSIVAKEYIPALQQDPTALERIGLTVSTNPDGTVHISQPPGDRNALGRLRFNFPNKFLVYQHDTPEKYLFAYDRRAFSHGCMRVQDPVKYAEVLLSIVRPHDGYTQDRIRRMFGDSELDIQFPTFIPVHLTYQTAFVDQDGKLEFRDDVYGRDKALLAILKSDERKVADIPIERRDNPIRREQLAMPEQTFGHFGFFSRVFGGPTFLQPAPPPAPRRHSAQSPTVIR
jgi:L,D-transpeptidase YcbB